jgi:hypothetical protein
MMLALSPRKGPQPLPDHKLVKRIKNGNTKAFETLVRKYQDYVNAVAFDITYDKTAAYFLAVEVLRGVWIHRNIIPDKYLHRNIHFKPFLFTLAKTYHEQNKHGKGDH